MPQLRGNEPILGLNNTPLSTGESNFTILPSSHLM
jgi:hypothetical protein